MNDIDNSSSNIGRREVIKGAASAGLIAATGISPLVYAAGTGLARPDLVRQENAKPGTRDWMLTKTRTVPGKINRILDNGRCRDIEGYCSANSVRAATRSRKSSRSVRSCWCRSSRKSVATRARP